MARFAPLLHQYWNGNLLSGLTLSLVLGWTTIAQADYRPPQQPSAPKSGSTAGTRGGCTENAAAGLTVLAPVSYVGQTTSTHPTFIWFVPEAQSYPLEFRLYREGSDRKRQVVQAAHLQSTAGIMQYTLPSEQPSLSIGQRYTWQVVMVCDLNHATRSSVAVANIEVVELPLTFQNQIKTAKTPIDRINLYAQNGFWYDAIAAAFKLPRNPQTKQLQLGLLQDLAKFERGNFANLNEQITHLRKIVTIEQQQL